MNPLLLLCPAVVLLAACQPKEAPLRFANPLAVEFGDPFILHASNGQYYMYGTGDNLNGFNAYSSSNLTDWKHEGQVYAGGGQDSWAVDCFWAPEVYERNGKYYLFFSANWKENPTREDENFRIGVAVADSPLVPFAEMYSRPVFDPGYPIIDANLFFDDNSGKVYLYYSRCCYKHAVSSEIADWAQQNKLFARIEESWIYGVEIKPDFSGIIGEPQLLLRPPLTMNDVQAEWESRSVTKNEAGRRWTEGSFLFEHHHTYYMLYSANFFGGQHYAVGYATATHPLGVFTKAANNPVLQKNTHNGGDVTGTGHCMMLRLPDEQMCCVYHARTTPTADKRMVFIDKMEILKDGTLVVHGPTIKQ
jgi:beta-xylosidase